MNKLKIFTYAALSFGLLMLTACSSSPDDEQKALKATGAEAMYQKAKQNIASGNFSGAADTLSKLDSKYPFGPLSHQVQLDLMYVYYKTGKNDEAIATIDRFIRLNPNHADIDYAYYMRGLVNMDSDQNLFQDLVGIDRSDRDPTHTREAFKDFRTLLQKYPNSKYAADAKKRMVYIKSQLAKYELAIARYYMKREAYAAAANRSKYVLQHYSDTPQLKTALEIMVECYEQLKLPDLKAHALETLKLNFPDDKFEG